MNIHSAKKGFFVIVHLLSTFNTVVGIIFYLWVECFFYSLGGFIVFCLCLTFDPIVGGFCLQVKYF